MIRLFSYGAMAAALSLSGCAANPADNVPKAETSAAQPVPEAQQAAPSKDAPPAVVKSAAEPATPAGAPSGSLTISPETSKVEFIGSKVTGSHKGGFKAFSGTAELTPDGASLAALNVEIDMNSTWADDPKLTGHLKAPDFFDVAKFPKATFVTTEIKPGGDKGATDTTHTVTGNLTLHGVTKSISFPAKVTMADGGLTLASDFSLNRKDFGITYAGMADNAIRNEVVIKIDVKAPKKA